MEETHDEMDPPSQKKSSDRRIPHHNPYATPHQSYGQEYAKIRAKRDIQIPPRSHQNTSRYSHRQPSLAAENDDAGSGRSTVKDGQARGDQRRVKQLDRENFPLPKVASGTQVDESTDSIDSPDGGPADTRDSHDLRPADSLDSQDDGPAEEDEGRSDEVEDQDIIGADYRKQANDGRSPDDTASTPTTLSLHDVQEPSMDTVFGPMSAEDFGDIKVITGINKKLRKHIKKHGSVLHETRKRLSGAFRIFQSETAPSVSWFSRLRPKKKSVMDETELDASTEVNKLLSMGEWNDLPTTHQKQGWWGGLKQTAPTIETLSAIGAASDGVVTFLHEQSQKSRLSVPLVKLFKELDDVTCSLQTADTKTRE